MDTGTTLYFLSAGNDLALVVAYGSDGMINTSGRVRGNWFPGPSFRLPAKVAPEIRMALRFSANDAEIAADGRIIGTVKLQAPSAHIDAFDIEGDVEDVYFGPSANTGKEPKFLRDLPASAGTPKTDSSLIFDIGAHDGTDTAYYLAKGFKVIAIDANPELAARLALTFDDEVRDGRLVVLNVGVGKTAGQQTFYINRKYSEWGSFDAALGNRDCVAEPVTVKTLPVTDIIEAFGIPHYVKIDIEGYDGIAVRSILSASYRPTFISFEGGALDLIAELAQSGYSGFKLVDQSKVPEARAISPAREGRTIEKRFRHGSSGPFGLDLEGEWQSEADIRVTLATQLSDPTHPSAGWLDIHARLDSSLKQA